MYHWTAGRKWFQGGRSGWKRMSNSRGGERGEISGKGKKRKKGEQNFRKT